MDKMIAIILWMDYVVWGKLVDTFPSLIRFGAVGGKLCPDKLVKYAVNKYGCLWAMWGKYGLV